MKVAKEEGSLEKPEYQGYAAKTVQRDSKPALL